MSLAGFKKQINKANQFMSEKIAGAKGTELDDDFCEMERKIDVLGKLVDELVSRTHELLQPNPASRMKMATVKSMSKLRGQAVQAPYPQPEGLLAECMIKYGKDLGEESLFGQALIESGESYKQLAEVKYSLEDNVKQNFVEPLQHLQNKDLKEVNHHRKKLEGRRLDYDCKKRKQQKEAGSVTDAELISAEEKFEESKILADTAMNNVLDNETEQISQLSSFIEAEINYHQHSVDILQALHDSLRRKSSEASNRPRREHVPKSISQRSHSSYGSRRSLDNDNYNTTESNYKTASPVAQTKSNSSKSQPCAEALYDFEPENEGELGFKEGDMINLISRIDENWMEGSVRGQTGYFPVTYVKVVVDVHD